MSSSFPNRRSLARWQVIISGTVLVVLAVVSLAYCVPPPAQAPLPTAPTDRHLPSPTTSPVVETPVELAPPRATSPPLDLPTATHQPSPTPLPTAIPTVEALIRFAVIGDYGEGGQAEADVAALVKSWEPDFIVTTGDNNYPDGSRETIDANIGQFYSEYIYPYKGIYGPGAAVNRFFPVLGNHDWTSENAQPYLDYFTLPGNERYYDFTWGPVHFFALNGDPREPDGVNAGSPQAKWLQKSLAASTSPWKIIVMHQPPYSSGTQGSVDWMRWPYQEWGASIVLSGHDHTYERITMNGFTYVINGLGGGARYEFEDILEGSQVRFSSDWGAMLVTGDSRTLTFQFSTRQGEIIDTWSLEQ